MYIGDKNQTKRKKKKKESRGVAIYKVILKT